MGKAGAVASLPPPLSLSLSLFLLLSRFLSLYLWSIPTTLNNSSSNHAGISPRSQAARALQ